MSKTVQISHYNKTKSWKYKKKNIKKNGDILLGEDSVHWVDLGFLFVSKWAVSNYHLKWGGRAIREKQYRSNARYQPTYALSWKRVQERKRSI